MIESDAMAAHVLDINAKALDDAVKKLRMARGLVIKLADLFEYQEGKLSNAPPASLSLGELADQLSRERRERNKFFNPELLGEPVWDILLDLYVRERKIIPTSVTSACIASGVPMTTALRYIKMLERKGLICRIEDKGDGRRAFLKLTNHGQVAMEKYLKTINR